MKETNFPKGIRTLNIPYMPKIKLLGEGIYEEMYEELAKYKEPKSTKSIEVIHRVYIDKEDPQLSHNSSTVIFHK